MKTCRYIILLILSINFLHNIRVQFIVKMYSVEIVDLPNFHIIPPIINTLIQISND